MDRVDWFFRQQVSQAELDSETDKVEVADRAIVSDILGFGLILTGPEPASVVENTVPDLQVQANVLNGYDQLGRRLNNLRSGFQGGVDKGIPPQPVDMSVDEVAASTAVVTPGNEKTISIFVEFTRNLSDPRTDGNGATVNFIRDESVKFNVVQSAEAGIGVSVPPALRADQVLLADTVLIFGQTVILDAGIDQTRRQAFALSLIHGPTHVEGGTDAIPGATPSVGGLFLAVDKTRFDILPETATDVSDLFSNQAKTFQPANFSAPATTTLDVTGLMVGQDPLGSASVEGIVTVAPNNRVIIRDDDFDDLLDALGNKVFGRITEAAAVWTLSFFSIIDGAGETAFDMTPFVAVSLQWFVQETFSLENLPTFDPLFVVPSDQVAGEIPDATETTKGKVELAADGEALADKVVQGNDSRLVTAARTQVDRSYFTNSALDISLTGFVIPTDGTIPQDTEGLLILSGLVTPKKIGNKFSIRCEVPFVSNIAGTSIFAALFQNDSVNAIRAVVESIAAGEGGPGETLVISAEFEAIDLTDITFSLRMGLDAGGATLVNNNNFGAATFTSMEILEYSS